MARAKYGSDSAGANDLGSAAADLPGRGDGTTPIRIAMWSGPRNISTALMRAFENRPDTVVVDEPLYAHYLLRTGAPHPGREQILRAQTTDWRAVVAALRAPLPTARRIYYQKHMAHHLFDDMAGSWLDDFRHAFLIREPEEMLTSLVRVIPEPTIDETALPQQWALYERVSSASDAPVPILDARDVLLDPAGQLRALCEALGIEFSARMLTWPAGPRATDGVWAPMWYASVEKSTGFQPYSRKAEQVPERLRDLLAECRTYYERLHALRLTTHKES